jgi:hypothetical protein
MTKQISGQVNVPSKQTVPLGTGGVYGKLVVKYHSPNSWCNVYIGNDGNNSVSPTTGYNISSDESIVFDYVELLSDIYLYADYVPSTELAEADRWIENKIVSWMILGKGDKE